MHWAQLKCQNVFPGLREYLVLQDPAQPRMAHPLTDLFWVDLVPSDYVQLLYRAGFVVSSWLMLENLFVLHHSPHSLLLPVLHALLLLCYIRPKWLRFCTVPHHPPPCMYQSLSTFAVQNFRTRGQSHLDKLIFASSISVCTLCKRR